MNRRLFVGALGAGLGLVFVPRLPRWRADDVFVERWSWAMGQPVHVMVFARSELEALDACAAALAELRRVERRLTLFDAARDLCELTRRAGRTRMRGERRYGRQRCATGRAGLAGGDRRPRSRGRGGGPHRGGDAAPGRRAGDRGEHRVPRALRVARRGPRHESRDGVAGPRAATGLGGHADRGGGGRSVDRDAGLGARAGGGVAVLLGLSPVIPGLTAWVSRDPEAT